MLHYQETPVIELQDALLEDAGVRLMVKREDQNHKDISGNKWWKLKYNLAEAIRAGHSTLLTFGGAYSNHIYAVAAAARELGLGSVGIIRGEESLPLNATLSFARACGMKLKYVSREVYRQKKEPHFLNNLQQEFGKCYVIPEGGTNSLAMDGCKEFAASILSKTEFDYLCLPVGTGGTIAGILLGLRRKSKVVGFSVLKGGGFLNTEVRNLLETENYMSINDWCIDENYHFGGYGKSTLQLEEFMKEQWQRFQLPLDPVYTAKMMFGVWDKIRMGFFKRGSTVLVLHTGGLQGKKP